MNALLVQIGWFLLFVLSWPVALLALVPWPLIWLLSIPQRLVCITITAVLVLIKNILFLPARMRGYKA